MSDERTIVTGPMQAVPGPHPTAIERRATFPLTPAPAPVRTDAVTVPRSPEVPEVPVAPEVPTESMPLRAVSAVQDRQRALESFGEGREPGGDYDKLVGQTLDGRYHVEQKIGEGGMGVVFAARHAVIERPLAIKVLKREVMRDTQTIRRFVQEAKAASRIGHPNIVDVTDFGTTPDGMTYSVMEYVSGRTLGAVLRRDAPFPMPRAARIAAQIARALGAAHDKGIVHRDLKPENVFLVDRDGRPDFVKIVDFGIAKVTPLAGQDPNAPRLTRAGSVFGTPEYMAPEQAAGRGDTDGRVDIYALGVILYQMTTGRVPHKGDSMVRTLAMQMLEPIVPPSAVRPDLDISPDLEALIMKALAKQREQRFQTMGELLAALDRLQTPVGLSVTGSPVYALVPLPPGADPAPAAGTSGAAASAPLAVALPSPVLGSMPLTPFPGPDASTPLAVALPITGQRPRTPSGPNAPITDQRSRTPSGPNAPIAVALPITGQRPRTPSGPNAPTGPSGARRLKDEPEFVSRDRPLTFDHAYTEERAGPVRRTRPLHILLSLLLVGTAGAIAFVLQTRSRIAAERAHAPAPPPAADTPAIALAPDAAAIAATPAAAAAPPPADATAVAAADPPEAAVRSLTRPRDLGSPAGSGSGSASPPGSATPVRSASSRRPVEIQVLTKPEGATLYAGGEYRGSGGAHLVEPLGTKLEVTCKHPGYKNGVVKLVFDGTRQAELCVLERVVVCIPGVKNPFDQCPD